MSLVNLLNHFMINDNKNRVNSLNTITVLQIRFECNRPNPNPLTYPSAGAGEAVTHGAALPLPGDDLLAVCHQFTLHLIADGDTVVADAHATGLWFPDVVVLVDLLVHRAALTYLLISS